MSTLPTIDEVGSARRRTGIAGALTVSFMGIAAFQAALALGAPLGGAAWGGKYDELPMGLRVASGFAVGIWILAALIVLGRAGVGVRFLPRALVQWGIWILAVLLGVGTLMNFASSSPYERFLWAPIALILSVLCFRLARAGEVPRSDAAHAGSHSAAAP